MSNGANIVPVFESSNGGVTKAVDKCLHYVGVTSLSIFGGNFVLGKVCWGMISVRCLEYVERCPLLGGSRGQVSRLLCRGCLLFGESVIRVLLYLHQEEFYHE